MSGLPDGVKLAVEEQERALRMIAEIQERFDEIAALMRTTLGYPPGKTIKLELKRRQSAGVPEDPTSAVVLYGGDKVCFLDDNGNCGCYDMGLGMCYGC